MNFSLFLLIIFKRYDIITMNNITKTGDKYV